MVVSKMGKKIVFGCLCVGFEIINVVVKLYSLNYIFGNF